MLANTVVVIHIGYFLFVVCGLIGLLTGSQWIRNIGIRLLHAAAVWIVVLEDIFHFECPLNTAEWSLRSASSAETTSGAAGFLNFLLRHTIPGSVLHIFYWVAGVFVIASLIRDLKKGV